MRRRTAQTALAASLLMAAGCGGNGDYAQYAQVLKQSLNGSFGKTGITLKQAAAIPYASMGWRLNGGNQNIIVLATDNAQGQLWTSAAHVVLLTQDGRIKRTVGLPHDLAALSPAGSGAMAPPGAALHASYLEKRSADFPDIGSFGVAIDCRGAARGGQSVVILGKKIATMRIEERCLARTLNWSFTNVYWIDRESGLVWRSLQHIHPRGDIVETEVFRPPG